MAPSYVASWLTPSLYPRQEPTFSTPLTTTTQSIEQQSNQTTNSNHDSISPPPPLYFKGNHRSSNTFNSSNESDLESGTYHNNQLNNSFPTNNNNNNNNNQNLNLSQTISIAKSLSSTILRYEYRPAYDAKPWNRVKIWYNCLFGKRGEILQRLWPNEFAGTSWRRNIDGIQSSKVGEDNRRDSGFGRISEEEVYNTTRFSTTSSRPISTFSTRSISNSSNQLPIHPSSFEFLSKLTILEDLIHSYLIKTRIILSLLEILAFVIGVLLIVAIAVEKGVQGLFIESMEVAIVLYIIASAIGIGIVRMNRFALSRALRSLSRDWNPLPISSNLHQSGFGNNHSHYLTPDPIHTSHSMPETEESRNQRQLELQKERLEASKPKLRWNLRTIEGFYHLGYTIVVKVELFTPPSFIDPTRSPSVQFSNLDRSPSMRSESETGVERRSSTASVVRRLSRVPVPVIDMNLEEMGGASSVVPPYSPQL